MGIQQQALHSDSRCPALAAYLLQPFLPASTSLRPLGAPVLQAAKTGSPGCTSSILTTALRGTVLGTFHMGKLSHGQSESLHPGHTGRRWQNQDTWLRVRALHPETRGESGNLPSPPMLPRRVQETCLHPHSLIPEQLQPAALCCLRRDEVHTPTSK